MDGERHPTNLYRLVGGPLNLFAKMARVNQYLEPAVPALSGSQRSNFYSYELQSRLQSNQTERDRLAFESHFFFRKKVYLQPQGRHSDNLRVCFTSKPVFKTYRSLILRLLYSYLAGNESMYLLSLVNPKTYLFTEVELIECLDSSIWNRNGVRFPVRTIEALALLDFNELRSWAPLIAWGHHLWHFYYRLFSEPSSDIWSSSHLNQNIIFARYLIEYLPNQIPVFRLNAPKCIKAWATPN